MSLDMVGQLNWLAVIVGAAIYFVLGAVWYAPPVLGRAWQRSIGWDPEATPPQMRITTYAIPAVAYLVMGVATAMLAAATGSDSVESGLILGLVVGIGLALARTAVDATFTPNLPQPWVWFAITGSYHLVGLIIVAVVVSVWV
ncbi:MAG: DUF1761 domain-containing protein [Candidatus Limnocylindria bacterium]